MSAPFRIDLPGWFWDGLVWADDPDYDEKTQYITVEWIEVDGKAVR